MNQLQDIENDLALWVELLKSEMAFFEARRSFLLGSKNRLTVIKEALNTVSQRGTALRVLQCLTIEEYQKLFNDLLRLATVGHADVDLVQQAILSLPRSWVLSKIEEQAEPLLQEGTYEEYRRLLELYIDLDLDLAFRLATRAMQSSDPDIYEAGEDAIAWLEKRQYFEGKHPEVDNE